MSSRRIAQTGLAAALIILSLSVVVLLGGAADNLRPQAKLPVSLTDAPAELRPMPFSAMAVRNSPAIASRAGTN
jgi:hypothetical protein